MAENYFDLDSLLEAAIRSLEQCPENQANYEIPVDFYSQTEVTPVLNGPSKRKRRARTIFTPYQLAMLDKEYRQRKYLDRSSRLNLAAHLGLPDRQIKIWFQNKRMKEKKNPQPDGGYVDPMCLLQQENQTQVPGIENYQYYQNSQYYNSPPQHQPLQQSAQYSYPLQQYNGWSNIQSNNFC